MALLRVSSRSAAFTVESICFWGLSALLLSMTGIGVLTGDNDWFYFSIALLTMGASAMMPWDIGWQTALNLVALAHRGYPRLLHRRLGFTSAWDFGRTFARNCANRHHAGARLSAAGR